VPKARKSQDCITQKELKKLLHYDPYSGVFTHLKKRGKRKVGDVAGCEDNNGYIVIWVNGKLYRGHRLAWFYVYGIWPLEVDHKYHIRNDNRINKLRAATRKENCTNVSLSISNTSGVTGVYWRKEGRKWKSAIGVDGESINLGHYFDKFEAICARKSAENKYGFHENHGASK